MIHQIKTTSFTYKDGVITADGELLMPEKPENPEEGEDPRQFSPLALTHNVLKDNGDRTKVFGLMAHTCGRSIVEEALSHGADPLEYVCDYYTLPESYCPGYVLGWAGDLVQIARDMDITWHGGVSSAQRQQYLDGSWENVVGEPTASLWKARWPNFKSPQHLYPSTNPNTDYIGVEMLPIVNGCGYKPARQGLLFTLKQHKMIRALYEDIIRRHTAAGTLNTSYEGARLVGHEDCNPIDRHDSKGGWDPGGFRQPLPLYFDWSLV
jgi:hypothetical protein